MASPSIEKVRILGRDSIHVGYNLIEHIVLTCLLELPSSTYVLITDTNIAPLYLSKFSEQFNERISDRTTFPRLPEGARFLHSIISPGESSKSRDTKADLEDWMLGHRCTRDTIVIALGGGVIGDMIGFMAATFMRGIKFVQVPTTLLAMVDSAIGGKTAVDTPLGKNLIGSFHQPEYIFEDLSFLNTLPNREFINGMAEVIKTAAIWNAEKFTLLERSAPMILNILAQPLAFDRFDSIRSLLQDVVISSILVKAEVVSADEKEGGLRNLLNFGHSIGHAYEAILTPEILHGEAVSVGMVKEAELSRYLGHLSPDAVGRLTKCLSSWGLPTDVNEPFITSKTGGRATPVNRLLDIMAVDKKNTGRTKRVVLLKKIGKCYELQATNVLDEHIKLVLAPNVFVHAHPDISNQAVSRKRKVICRPPGSKSISNRAMILAALSGGTTKLINLLTSDDTRYMQNALELLGAAKFNWNEDGSLTVIGSGRLSNPGSGKEIYLGNAGTAARFLTGVVTLVDGVESVTLTGNERMKVRPIGPLVDALRSNGSTIHYQNTEGCLPLSVLPGLKGGRIELSAKVSSQYVSSLLMVAPFAQSEVHLILTGDKVISELYIDMTTAMMATFGINVQKVSSSEYIIPQGRYHAPDSYEIESDASSATYPLALAALLGIEVHVPNIGSASLQGDARFAKDVLEPMGCRVTQTSTSTTVQGPPTGNLRAIESVDMETMTDAFLTATVLAATTGGSMSITGIANQRVKECNRIRAMATEFHKFGVTCEELPDGLTIHGVDLGKLTTPSSAFASDGVGTYDDHRVAMSFSLLAAVTSGATLLHDKACTSKTWPEWWDVLSRDFGVQITGSDELPERPRASVDGESSIIVVGMRGAGKSTMGALAGSILGRPFIDLDNMLETDYKKAIQTIIKEDGWPAFRQMELATLQKFLSTRGRGWVAACGGGVVETPAAVELLRNYSLQGGVVLQIHRNIDRIVEFLGNDQTRPVWNQAKGKSESEILSVWNKRAPAFSLISNFQYYSSDSSSGSTTQMAAYSRFLKHVQGRTDSHAQVVRKQRSYFLSLTYPDLRQAAINLTEICAGCDALELRVDLLVDGDKEVPSTEFVLEQVAYLRENCNLPLIFTIRTRSQGGNFPDTEENAAIDLMCLAGKQAIEYIDFEMTWSEHALREVRKYATCSRIIASHHDVLGSLSFKTAAWTEYYTRGCKIGDVVKLVGKASYMEDNFDLAKFREKLSSDASPPLIAINIGSEGTLSRMLNTFFTPVTHESLPFKAAPGQLSLKEINQGLTLLGRISQRQFHIFGNPVEHSRSPALHNSGFQALGLPHNYTRLPAIDVREYLNTLQTADFGGASVTIPHKQSIIPLLNEISEEANLIGAVNTIIPLRRSGTSVLRGENTDWVGITQSLKREMGVITPDSSGLVLGAGGTARAAVYALHHLGIATIYVANKSPGNLEAIKNTFPFITPVTNAGQVSDVQSLCVTVSTVPGDGKLDATIESIASTAFARGTKGSSVLLEMAYKPNFTAMMGLAEACEWKTIGGLEPLVEQGIKQFQLWTGFTLSADLARSAVLGQGDYTRQMNTVATIGNWQS